MVYIINTLYIQTMTTTITWSMQLYYALVRKQELKYIIWLLQFGAPIGLFVEKRMSLTLL